MRNAVVAMLALWTAVGCSGGSSGDDSCADPTSYEDWPDPYSDIRCQYEWLCDDGQSGTPDDAWLAQCKRAFETFLPAPEDACFDECKASQWLNDGPSRIRSCADDIITSAEPVISFCPGGEPRE
ncbi:MAG: hypothetical protein AB8H79_08745 [Myxococcota bacterium]